MIEQITKGIKISIETEFEGTFYKDDCIHYAFSYEVVIENQSPEVAQLIARKWNIMEALNENEIVIGEGVVGMLIKFNFILMMHSYIRFHQNKKTTKRGLSINHFTSF